MKLIINFIAKITGANFIWEKLSGYKTKIGGMIAILSGLADILSDLIKIQDFASLLAYLKTLPQDNGWLLLVGGLAVLGIGHKIEKGAEKPK